MSNPRDRRCHVCGGDPYENRTRDDGTTYRAGAVDTNWWRDDLEAWNPERVLVCHRPHCRDAMNANDRAYRAWLKARRERLRAERAARQPAPPLADAGGWAAWGAMYTRMAKPKEKQ